MPNVGKCRFFSGSDIADWDFLSMLIEVGQARFRPIFLTSVTTFGGLLPMLLETSLQAKVMIPMALSLAGGVMFSLFFVLLFIPVLYSYYVDLLAMGGGEEVKKGMEWNERDALATWTTNVPSPSGRFFG